MVKVPRQPRRRKTRRRYYQCDGCGRYLRAYYFRLDRDGLPRGDCLECKVGDILINYWEKRTDNY